MKHAQPTKRNVVRRTRIATLAVAGGLLFGATPAGAQSSGSASANWNYEFTPYLWGAGMKGTVQSGSLPATNVDMSFTDIVDVLDFGLMGAFEARKGRWGLYLDAIYMKVSDSATVSRTGAGPLGATLTATANITLKQSMLAAAAMYRVSGGPSTVDVLGGLRYNKLDVEAAADFTLLGLAASRSRSGDKDWVDPYIGVRLQHALSDRWKFEGYADVGGFGVGSDLTYQVIAGFNYTFSKSVSAKMGYRYLNADYDKGGFVYDMKMDGLYLGVGIAF